MSNHLVSVVLASVLVSFALAHAPSSANAQKLVAFWGQNQVGNLYAEPTMWERPLIDVCKDNSYDIIHIAYVNSHKAVNNMPGLDLSFHCQTPFPGYNRPTNGPVLLRCPDVEADIKACQQLGKKVMIVVEESQQAVATDADGIKFATDIWNLFLGGQGDRPFGSAVLDGVDLHIKVGVTGYSAFVTQLRSLMDAGSSSKAYYLSGTPSCEFPDGYFGPTWAGLPLTDVPDKFDYLSISTIGSQCSYRNKDLFWSRINLWTNWAKAYSKLDVVLGLPSYPNAGAVGDYIDPPTLIQDKVLPVLQQNFSNLVGISLWDASYDEANHPCGNDVQGQQRTYSDVLRVLYANSNVDVNTTCPVVVYNPPKDNPDTRSQVSSASRGVVPPFSYALVAVFYVMMFCF
eukprot:GILJ01002799.1.p1 GENE.GILJ01002799.1~~GILJ01002799.1.p1  ORF type:complete len:401 (-),score=53.81 GILJ01002799.1:39-1241(-)